MKKYQLFICVILSFWASCTTTLRAQNGDQILDGIGETGLIARYVFDGDAKDWSRNNLHGKIQDTKAKFVNDELFGTVLSLPADSQAFVSIPGDGLIGEESLSISGWIFLRSTQKNQLFFDFGKNQNSHWFFTPTGTQKEDGIQTEVSTEAGAKYKTKGAALETGKWNHVAVVINIPSKTISTFVNSVLVSETKNAELDLAKLFDYNSAEKNKLYIGKSLGDENIYLNAKLHDFRIYRVPLTDKQITRIYNNALKEGQEEESGEEQATDLPKFPAATPQLYNQFLTSVSDVNVETVVGSLPRLPSYIKGVYKNGIQGPEVRVIWPSPKDNNQVLKSGQYTVTGIVSGTDLKPKAIVTVKAAKEAATPERKLEAFKLEQVVLNSDADGHKTKFVENRDKFLSTLATTDPDSFLYMFRNAFGQTQPKEAEPLGVWDTQETKLRGHATGHYLTAIAQAYASTGYDKTLQANFANKMEYMVNTLYQLSQLSGKPKTAGGKFVSDPTAVPFGPGKTAYDSDLSPEGIRTDYENWGTGFISAYPPDQFIMLENGATYGGQKTQIWAPYYTLHKILAGLMDVYEVSGNEKALETAKGMGNWVYARMKKLPTETLISMWNRYIAGEFGGMNEAMARLYRITKDPHYLEVAQLFDNIKVFYGDANHTHGLAKNVDTFRGLHANQHIPQIMGALEMYRDSNTPDYYRVADNFWYKTVNDYMYTIGGVAGARNPANAECFISQPATIYENGFSSGGQNETCATYNMLKLTGDLFLYEQRGELMDYYERGLYNHILSSVAENSPANTYHVPLRPGSVKQFGNAHMTGFTCCNGTAIESNTKFQNSIYFKSADNNALYVNLYVPSTLNWTEKNITVEQTTDFPNEDFTKFKIKGNGKFDLKVRVPHWATKGFFVKINGKEEKVKATPGSYLSLNKKWKDGDIVELRMPFQFHLEPVMDQQNIASLFYGPILLAAQETEPRKDWCKVTFDANDIGKAIKGNPKKLEFTIDGVSYKPFYETYGRHSVYLDVTLK
ncbi:Ig-like domain (group 4) [Flavobacterium sp. CF108]|uniref:beta-L-arabinofuranosidase domain-containing protein n=1 Tax=unclassified Flavobacterium TaxID=196869 RepID=UPI0008D67978|nr:MULTISPECIES: beta-L-arabinofuranosidase domain-containing protein [unclassified Flavobacterium]SEO21621.1 Ig-like domain (group 4) [Flavobacterium sp. fv08]SHG51435.1 Ig-like domain (group 4) [Flavobacterium sp. CF108]